MYSRKSYFAAIIKKQANNPTFYQKEFKVNLMPSFQMVGDTLLTIP